MESNNELDMYLDFRKEIDVLAFPLIKKNFDYIKIYHLGKQVGFLIVCDGYVESLYVKPEFRRLGLAKKAVLNYINQGKPITRLHILDSNKVAHKFWSSIFDLYSLDFSSVDTLYSVMLKQEGKE